MCVCTCGTNFVLFFCSRGGKSSATKSLLEIVAVFQKSTGFVLNSGFCVKQNVLFALSKRQLFYFSEENGNVDICENK